MSTSYLWDITLDARLRELSSCGVWVSTHPDVKQNRGNGGQGVWKVEALRGEKVRVLDVLRGSASGDDAYVLCEINVSSVIPFPPRGAPAKVGKGK